MVSFMVIKNFEYNIKSKCFFLYLYNIQVDVALNIILISKAFPKQEFVQPQPQKHISGRKPNFCVSVLSVVALA